MNMQHTQGPWKMVDAHLGFVVTANEGTYDVAVVRNIGKEDNAANARLIAAAPELLDALRRILNAHDSDNNGAFMGEAVLCASFAAQARRAIAKAEGIEQNEVNPWRTDYAAIARATGESA